MTIDAAMTPEAVVERLDESLPHATVLEAAKVLLQRHPELVTPDAALRVVCGHKVQGESD